MRLIMFWAAPLATAAVLALAPPALAGGSINEKGFNCAGGTDTGDSDSCRSKARDAAIYEFSFAVINNSSYDLEHAILKAKLATDSNWSEVREHSANINDHEGVTFSFDDAWIADKLGTDTTTLETTGFYVRGEIRSVYSGGGGTQKQTNCPIVQLKYQSGEWRYNKKDQNTTYPATKNQAFMWKPEGTAGNVSCKVASET